MTNPADYRPAPGSIPTQPGVYRFRDPHGQVLYVGKAKNLRARLNSYFGDLAGLHNRTRTMVTTAASVEWTVVRSEVEALVLEHSWIKEYDPRFNVMFRDDKSYPWLVVTMNEDVPRIHTTRAVRAKGARYFGPYAKVWAINETVDALLQVIPMRSCSDGVFRRAQASGRPCLLADLGKCAAPCVGRVSVEDHRDMAARVCQVLGGNAKSLVRDLTSSMQEAAERQEYETAARARDRLTALTTVLDRNAVVLGPDENLDVVAMIDEEYEAAVHTFAVRGGRIVGERGWIVDKPTPLEAGELVTQVLQTMYEDEATRDVPGEVIVPELPHDEAASRDWLAGIRGSRVQLRRAVRGKKAELADTAQRNAREALARHRQKRAQDITARSAALEELREALGMGVAPLRIECIDISHTGGTHQSASMVVFEDGLARKKEYRTFSVRAAADDTAAMHEVVTRRFTRYLEQAALPVDERETTSFAYPPQLLVVDGGQPQVAAAQRALDDLGITDVALCGLAKRLEEVWLPGDDFPVVLARGSEALYLMQRLRDEAHRFALRQHRGKRSKAMTASTLDEIPGVGRTRAQALLRHFGSVARIRAASVEQIALVPGVGDEMAARISAALAGQDGMLDA